MNHFILRASWAQRYEINSLADENQSPIITSFYFSESDDFTFGEFYNRLKAKGFVIYPGKVTDLNTFRIGNIGAVTPAKINALLTSVEECSYWKSTV